MTISLFPAARSSQGRKKVCTISLVLACLAVVQQAAAFGIPAVSETAQKLTTSAPYQNSRAPSFPALFSKPDDEDDAENSEKEWSQEESLLVMSLSPLPDVSCEDSLSRISQYIRSFPFAAILPVQPLQALPTDDGGLELKFLRKKTATKSGVDGGIRFFVNLGEDDKIEVLVKRNSDGQSIPKMFAEKLVVQSFAKGMALGSDFGNDNSDETSSIKVPNTRIESPTKDMVQIQSVFHKWI